MKLKCILLLVSLIISVNIFSQTNFVYVKFVSKNVKEPRRAIMYLTTKNASSYSVLIPSKEFYLFRCDSIKPVEILSDVLKYENLPNLIFKIPGKFNCGDSVLVDIDQEKSTIINRNSNVSKK